MTEVRTNFAAPVHGFKFVNRFEFPLSVMFQLPFVGPVNLDDVVYGLCGGMCFGALDYFGLGKPIPGQARVEDLEPAFLRYLWDRQLDSLRLPVVLKVIEWMLQSDEALAMRVARYEYPKLRRRLDKGEPVVLVLVRAEGVSNPTQNHQVLATGYDFDENTRDVTIHLYDPNHPTKQPTLHLNLLKPSDGIGVRQSTAEGLRGFFTLNYRRERPPA
jgi:hypothetical protein